LRQLSTDSSDSSLPNELPESQLQDVEAIEEEEIAHAFPDVMNPDPLHDDHVAMEFPPTKRTPYANRVVIRSVYEQNINRLQEKDGSENSENEAEENDADEEGDVSPLSHLPLSRAALEKLYKFQLISRRITQQTGKGKIHRQYALVVVGNGDGLVGYGEGKDEELPMASDKAFAAAVRNMDSVERFEKRTLWTDIETKLGSTHIILRPRPVGFGLRCNPNVHQVLKAAGIKDASAKVWGSRNPLNVIKALFRVLQAGNAPLAMGDGFGGKTKKLDKGSGLRNKSAVERDRGRKLLDLRTY
jgi:small subunit ribosomal protein S5